MVDVYKRQGKIDKFELAKVGQATEHNYCGVNCGITVSYTHLFFSNSKRTLCKGDSAESNMISFLMFI